MEVGRRTNRAAHLVADERRGRHRPCQLVAQAAGHEADQAGCPRVVADDERSGPGARRCQCPRRVDGERRELAASLVDNLELRRQLLGARGILLEEERDRQLGVGDAAGSVDARHDAEAKVACRRVVRRLRGAAEQGTEPGVRRLRQLGQAEPDDGPALTGHRRHVGDRADGRDRGEAICRHAVSRQEGRCELVGEACTGEIGIGVVAVGSVRVDHGHRPRQRGGR